LTHAGGTHTLRTMRTAYDVIESAMALSPQERASIALRLLRSLEETPARVDDDDRLATEVARRMAEVRAGSVALLDGPGAIESIRRAIGK
jgi:putative addiction module component (TIGR02574 family)